MSRCFWVDLLIPPVYFNMLMSRPIHSARQFSRCLWSWPVNSATALTVPPVYFFACLEVSRLLINGRQFALWQEISGRLTEERSVFMRCDTSRCLKISFQWRSRLVNSDLLANSDLRSTSDLLLPACSLNPTCPLIPTCSPSIKIHMFFSLWSQLTSRAHFTMLISQCSFHDALTILHDDLTIVRLTHCSSNISHLPLSTC
jgi:hypothetical protein